VPEGPGLADVIAEQRELLSRLRAVVEAKDAEAAALRAELEASRERERRLGLRLAELERRLAMDSSDSGTPSSKERIGAKERRRVLRQESERERRKDRRRGGQPGHPGRGLARDPDPGERKDADPPAQCRRCGTGLDGAAPAAPGWAQVVDTGVIRTVTEYSLPGLECPCCGTVTVAGPPPGAHAGSVSYGPALNAAAVVLASCGNVPPERAAHVMAMLLGVPVSAGWVDKAAARLSRQLEKAGFDAAMCAALAAEPVLAADETPVNVLAPGTVPQPAGREDEDPEDGGRQAPGAPHVLAVRTPGERLTWLQALGSRRKEDVTGGIPARFSGFLITDGYTAYQRLLSRLAGVQQCCQHVIRRCRAVTKPGPGGLQSWAGDVISILREAHQAVEEARARGDTALDPEQLEKLRQRYGEAAAFGVTHNRLRDWHDGNHPGYAPGCWLLAAGIPGAGLAVHPRIRRRVDQQQRRAGRQRAETPPGRLRVLAHPRHPRPMVPHPQLPRLRREPRPQRPGRHPRSARRKTLATTTPRTGLTPNHAPPVNGHELGLSSQAADQRFTRIRAIIERVVGHG
jgi:transposase IS66 family protein